MFAAGEGMFAAGEGLGCFAAGGGLGATGGARFAPRETDLKRLASFSRVDLDGDRTPLW